MIGLETVVRALGGASFSEAMLASLNGFARVDHYALIRFDGARTARLVTSASHAALNVAREVQEEYLDVFQKIDPNRHLFHAAGAQATQVTRMPRESVPNTRYRLCCYDRPGLVDRISVVAAECDDWYCLNLFRTRENGCFATREAAAVQKAAALLAALAIKHDRLLSPVAPRSHAQRLAETEARLRQIDASLTPREREVLARIVAGLTSEGIALDLQIGLNSVLTYRKRGYAKLRISSQNELLTLCLSGRHTRM